MTSKGILFFADRLPPLVGGMEMHARYFIEHFSNHKRFPLLGIITKNAAGEDFLIAGGKSCPVNIKKLPESVAPTFVFFNSGRWLEQLAQIKDAYPDSIFIYRTGGNEILKADLIHNHIPNHSLRQAYWVKTLNTFVDILITNSLYTETRLSSVGVTCRLVRFVGGVNTLALKNAPKPSSNIPTIFCAARFVSYKNHALLLSVIHKLMLRGNSFKVRLAGDGPLFGQTQKQAGENNLTSVITFLGTLSNEQTCQEIASANLYVQLSVDHVTQVPGGSYIHSECMGRAILEALSAGIFVIACRSGALSEIVTEDRGTLIESRDPQYIADIIEPLLIHPPPRLSFYDGYDWAKIFRHYEDLFEHTNEYTDSH
jgi:glycosyltransferase involved in cell wall biosynthesis